MIVKKFEIASTDFQFGWNDCLKKDEGKSLTWRDYAPDSLEDKQWILGYTLCKKLLKENKE